MTNNTAREWLQRIDALPISDPIRIMNVCGGHERSLNQAGLRSLLPEQIELIPGPGCPVCVCPEEAIAMAIELALNETATVVTFGDMLRVPINGPKQQPRSLEQARSAGGDIRAVASPIEARELALRIPNRAIVFFLAGFETTAAPLAALITEGVPDNLLFLLAARRTWPAVAQLLASDTPGFDALIAPGHVSTVMGSNEWRFVAEQHQLPVAVAGFDAASLLAAIFTVTRQRLNNEAALVNCYPAVVKATGNPVAQKMLHKAFDTVDAPWRGIGTIPQSGYDLQQHLHHHDARLRYSRYDRSNEAANEMPPGCDCARVVLGRCYPDQCRLYGTACTPADPIGPCMVSDEGACRIWWSHGLHKIDSRKTG